MAITQYLFDFGRNSFEIRFQVENFVTAVVDLGLHLRFFMVRDAVLKYIIVWSMSIENAWSSHNILS